MKKLFLIGLVIFLVVALNGISVAAEEAKTENEVVVVDEQEDQTGTKVAVKDSGTLEKVALPHDPVCTAQYTKCCDSSPSRLDTNACQNFKRMGCSC